MLRACAELTRHPARLEISKALVWVRFLLWDACGILHCVQNDN